MTHRFVGGVLFGGWLILAAGTAYADCVVTTREAGTQIRIAGGNPFTLLPGRIAVAKGCAVTVVSGSICLLRDDQDLSKACPRVTAGGAGPRGTTDQAAGMVAMLGSFLQGDTKQRPAGKRLSDAEEVPGFPSGEVLMPAKDMLIPLVWVKDGPVTAFVLEDTVARTRVSMPIEAGAIRVAHRHLAVGRTYKWQATVGGQNRAGSFTTVRPTEQVELNEQLKQIAANPDYASDPAARAVARAMVLYSEHFAFDALQEISGFVQRQ